MEAGSPEFIDLLTSENEEYQLKLGGGLLWLDTHCIDHHGKTYLECGPVQRHEVLDQIAYRKNAKANPELSQGVAFFAFLRDMTCDGFYTSKIFSTSETKCGTNGPAARRCRSERGQSTRPTPLFFRKC